MSLLQGAVVMVTGASSGMGRATSLIAASEGARVLCTDLTEAPLPTGYDGSLPTHKMIQDSGGEAMFLKVDVTQNDELERAVRAAVDVWGRLDVMVNVAGVFKGFSSVVETPREQWDSTFDINVTGTWLGCRVAIRQMLSQEIQGRARGRIINIASCAAFAGQANVADYSASKSAVVGLTKSLAIENAPHRINVNAIAPGYLPTAMTKKYLDVEESREAIYRAHPWPELGTADDIGHAVAFLASDWAGWITGAVLAVDGGFIAR